MVRNEDVGCDIKFYNRRELTFEQTNEYDPNPRPRIKLREWHLTAKTVRKRKSMEFITVYRPYKIADGYRGHGGYQVIPGGYLFELGFPGGELTALLPTDDTATLEADGLRSKGAIKCRLEKASGQIQIIGLDE